MSKISATLAEVMQKAADENAEVIQSDDTHLLLDLDTDEQYKQYGEMFSLVNEKFRVINVETWDSKNNMHFYLTLAEPAGLFTRIALQAALGSDPKREVLALDRALNGMEEPSFLFKPRR